MSQTSVPTIKTVKGVYCDTHGEVPGYIVCSEIAKFNKKPVHIAHPTVTALGELICDRGAKNHELWEFTLICVHCARDRGFVDDPAKRPPPVPGRAA